MSNTFNVGDQVMLNSGGPVMTIQGYDEDIDAYECVWFDGPKPHHASFPGATLSKYTPASGSF